MKFKPKKLVILLVIGLVFPLLINNIFDFSDEQETTLPNPKKSEGFVLTFIHVDGNWSATTSYDWCDGDGSWGNPYIIENVTIDASSSPTGSGIFIDNSKNDYFVIRNCTVNYAGDVITDAGIKLTNTCNGTIFNNTVSDNNYRGISLSDGCDNNTIIENLLYDNGDKGICLEKDCDYNKILNNTANHNILGIYIHGNPGSDYNRIINNTANDNPEGGIYISNACSYNNITGNIAYNNGKEGIFLDSQSDFNKIINNTANHNGGTGIMIHNGCDDNTIANNIATDNTECGILLYNSEKNKIINNTVNRNGDTGIYLYYANSDYNNITGNIVNDNVKIGIFLYYGSTNNNIKNNMINRNNLGIGLKQDSNNNIVSENILIDNGMCIFELGCTDNIIENNTCSGSFKEIPIFINGTATGAGAHNWTWVEQQSWFGGGSGTKDIPYIIENLNRDGLAMTNCIEIINSNVYFIIRNCTLHNSGSDSAGIRLDNVSNGTLTENNCSFNYRGISLGSNCDFNNITGNMANNNENTGISLGSNCDFNNIMGNIANNNTYNGIYLNDYCDNNTISNNVANDNADTGIYLSGGGLDSSYNNTISGNLINDNNYGIQLEGACHFNKIIENNVYNNILGISLDSECSNNSVYKNFFLKNGQHAIDDGIDNTWNSTTIGNYWDNHTGPDITPQNGIVDEPYTYIGGSAGSTDYLPIAEDHAPQITINSPNDDDVFGSNAPSYDVTITDDLLFEMWYTLDGGLHNYTFTELTGKINQSAWASLSEGSITITFYAKNTLGNLAFKEVTITKSIPPGGIDPTIIIVIVVVFVAGGVAVIAGVFVFMKKRAKPE
ncbi:MAG: right-handed parallel beta-helix repeat-containing protein [Candidatus Lokiarchaeota archaeon]|nr:right-handed parallel beta-helix repeat-containing protein [Candidatus Lokiarchaeota archaeon]